MTKKSTAKKAAAKKPAATVEQVRTRIVLLKRVRLVEIAAAVVLLIAMALEKIAPATFTSVGLILFMAILGSSIGIGKMKAEVGE